MNIEIVNFEKIEKNDLFNLLKLRQDVFIVDQNCPYHDIDDLDLKSTFVLLKEDNKLLATLRIIPSYLNDEGFVKIGRVVSSKMGYGYGKKILLAALDFIKKEFKTDKIFLEAQCYARPFYEKCGFEVAGDEFLEDNIPHVRMEYIKNN